MVKHRIEWDSMGETLVPDHVYWGAQTARSLQIFDINCHDRMPKEMIISLLQIKKFVAKTNLQLGILEKDKAQLIDKAIIKILAQDEQYMQDNFPLLIWQTGSGTQTNMNINEVIANTAIELSGGIKGSKNPIHPNDHVNKSQSSNDVFPTAMHLVAYSMLQELIEVIDDFIIILVSKINEFTDIIKIGRTHLQDAVALSLGQEFSAYLYQLQMCYKQLKIVAKYFLNLPIGGTAIGTGLNTQPGFDSTFVNLLNDSALYKDKFKVAINKFALIAAHDHFVSASSAVKTLAVALTKMANDIRWLASGPRCGLGELTLPANEPGSSIMPGKVNPTLCEALTMICAQVIGNDSAITFACSQGHLELNTFKPVIIHNLTHSIALVRDICKSFSKNCLQGITANKEIIQQYVDRSLMLVTALTPYIGYDKATKIAKYALENNTTLKKAAIELQFLTEKQFDEWIQVENMI